MRRRDFLALLAGVLGPRTLRAQQKTMPVIGFLALCLARPVLRRMWPRSARD